MKFQVPSAGEDPYFNANSHVLHTNIGNIATTTITLTQASTNAANTSTNALDEPAINDADASDLDAGIEAAARKTKDEETAINANLSASRGGAVKKGRAADHEREDFMAAILAQLQDMNENEMHRHRLTCLKSDPTDDRDRLRNQIIKEDLEDMCVDIDAIRNATVELIPVVVVVVVVVVLIAVVVILVAVVAVVDVAVVVVVVATDAAVVGVVVGVVVVVVVVVLVVVVVVVVVVLVVIVAALL